MHSKFQVGVSMLTIKDSYVEDEIKLYSKKHNIDKTKLSIIEKFKLEDGEEQHHHKKPLHHNTNHSKIAVQSNGKLKPHLW